MWAKEKLYGFQLWCSPIRRRGAVETRRNLLELFYNLLQGSYNKTIDYKNISYTKLIIRT